MDKSTKSYVILVFSAVVMLIGGMSLQIMAQTEKGIDLYNSWEYEKAEEALHKVLKKDPADVQAGYYLGLSLFMQGKYQEALDVLQKAKASMDKAAGSGEAEVPDKGQLEIALTQAYLGLKRIPEVLESLEAAEKAKANPVDIHTFRGAYYLEQNSVQEASQELEKAIELDSQNAYTYYYAGFAHLRLGDPAKAVQMFQVFLRLTPYAPEAEKTRFLVDSLC